MNIPEIFNRRPGRENTPFTAEVINSPQGRKIAGKTV
jgi:hypothetical protein